MENHLLRVIEADNPWLLSNTRSDWFAKYLPSEYIPRKLTLQETDKVCLVTGPRQAGKSTLIWKHLSARHPRFLYLSCEELAIRQWASSPALFWEEVSQLVESPVPLFFEEIQHLPEAGLFLKGLVDRHIKIPIVATGSSAFDLESKTRESLAGRADRYLLLPFSLDELSARLQQKGIILDQLKEKILIRLLCHGGYPAAVLSDSPEPELNKLVESFVIRDVSDRFRIRYPEAFRKVLGLAASQSGNLVNYSEWASIAGISNDTVAEYVSLLQETHVIRLVKAFVGGKRAEITSTPKVYFVDNGIRNVLFGGFQPPELRPDRGILYENLAFSELYKNSNPLIDTIGFWRSKARAEVDFVFQHQGKIIGIEVKAGDLRGNLPRASRSFIDAYQPELFLAVSSTEYPSMRIGNTEVRFIQLADLGRTIRAWAL